MLNGEVLEMHDGWREALRRFIPDENPAYGYGRGRASGGEGNHGDGSGRNANGAGSESASSWQSSYQLFV